MSHQHKAADLGLKSMNAAHRVLLKLTGKRVGRQVFGMPTVELHVTGRKSGQRRSTLLTAPVFEDGRIVLVASKGGDDRDPEWYRNLVEHPEAELTIDDVTTAWTARTATSAERAELWPRMTAAYKGYAAYQKRTERVIPLVICTPRNSAAD